MGGNAKVVKKAVAPAMRNGSFFKSSFEASFKSFIIIAALFRGFAIVIRDIIYCIFFVALKKKLIAQENF